jgi:hypothetical protein
MNYYDNNLPQNYQKDFIRHTNTLKFQNQPYNNEIIQPVDVPRMSFSSKQVNLFGKIFQPKYQERPQQPIVTQEYQNCQFNSCNQQLLYSQYSDNNQNNINSQNITPSYNSFNSINNNNNFTEPIKNYDPTKDCEALNEAMKGFSVDSDCIISIIRNKNNSQRLQIREKFNEKYKKDLIKTFNSKLFGNFRRTVMAVFYEPIEYDAINIYKAIKGLITDEEILIEIFGTRNKKQINSIKEKYSELHNEKLEDKISSKTSGNFQVLLKKLLEAKRSENMNPKNDDILKDVEDLYNAGKGKKGDCNENIFIEIFSLRSDKELVEINKQYSQKTNHNLTDIIKDKISGHLKKLLNTILYSRINPSAYYAKNIFDSVEGLGTNDKKLIRNIVVNCENDMNSIIKEYKKKFKNDMIEDVKDDTSGDYKKILCELINK